MDEASRTADARRHALRWLAHPVSVVALLTMAVNDHLLKQAHGTWWTGKLSDVAGLVFFPALVAVAVSAVLPRVRPSNLTVAAIATTAAGFTWVKVTASGAAAASALLTGLAGPSHVWRDPTDLLALPALALAVWSAQRVRRRPSEARRVVAIAIMPAALLASVATSRYDPPVYTGAVVVEGALYVQAGTGYGRYWSPWAEPALTRQSDADLKAALANAPRCLDAASSQTCFRPTPERFGVDVSYDGGTTWRKDLWVSNGDWGSPAGPLHTFSVTVGELDGEELVIAANGADGVAVRQGDGTWVRLEEDLSTSPLDLRVGMAQRPSWKLAPTLATSLCAWAVAYGILGARSRRRIFPRADGGAGRFAVEAAARASYAEPSPRSAGWRVAGAAALVALAVWTAARMELISGFGGGAFGLQRESTLWLALPALLIIVPALAAAYSLLGLMARVRLVDAVWVPTVIALFAAIVVWVGVAASSLREAPEYLQALAAMVIAGSVSAAVRAWSPLPRRVAEERWSPPLTVEAARDAKF